MNDRPMTDADVAEVRGCLEAHALARGNGGTHWEGCWRSHWPCLDWMLLREVERLRKLVGREES